MRIQLTIALGASLLLTAGCSGKKRYSDFVGGLHIPLCVDYKEGAYGVLGECPGRGDTDYTFEWDSGIGRFTRVATGNEFTCAVRTDQRLECWTSDLYNRPEVLAHHLDPPEGSFSSVGAQGCRVCALRQDDGSIVCWGSEGLNSVPPPAGRFDQLDASGACGTRPDGSIECWGFDHVKKEPYLSRFPSSVSQTSGPCRLDTDGSVSCSSDYSLPDAPEGTFSEISGRAVGAVCGIRTDGTLKCWGDYATTPPTGTFTAISGSPFRICGLHTDGRVSCWGHGLWAMGLTAKIEFPAPDDGDYVQLAVGSWHACALRDNGILDCWGLPDFCRICGDSHR